MQPVFDHYTIKVNNLEESALFYTNIMGLQEITNKTEKPHIRWFGLGNGELHLVKGDSDSVKTNVDNHLALRVGDFEAFKSRLKSNEVEIHDSKGKPGKITVRSDGIKQLYFQDPDGYWIEVNNAKG